MELYSKSEKEYIKNKIDKSLIKIVNIVDQFYRRRIACSPFLKCVDVCDIALATK